MANRIHSAGPYRQVEYVAGGGITPGMLIMLNSSNQVVVHNDEGGAGQMLIAAEDALQGRIVSTAYVATERVTAILPQKGCEFNGFVEDGQDIAIGDRLIGAGNGKWKEASDLESGETLDPGTPQCIALEANDLTGSDSSDTLSLMRVL